MSSIEECPFCHLDDRVLKENKSANLFLSDPRKVSGHFLVTPKRHVELPWELKKEEMADIFELVFLIQERLVKKYGGSDIRQNCRPFMKQGRIKVDHVHYHVYPRSPEDELFQRVERFELDLFKSLSDEERELMVRLLEGED